MMKLHYKIMAFSMVALVFLAPTLQLCHAANDVDFAQMPWALLPADNDNNGGGITPVAQTNLQVCDAALDASSTKNRTWEYVLSRWPALTIADIDRIMGFETQGPLGHFLKMAVVSDFDAESFNKLIFALYHQESRNRFVAEILLHMYFINQAAQFDEASIPQALETLSNYPLCRAMFLQHYLESHAASLPPAKVIQWLKQLHAADNGTGTSWANEDKIQATKNDLAIFYLNEVSETLSIDHFDGIIAFATSADDIDGFVSRFISTPGKIPVDKLSRIADHIKNMRFRDQIKLQYLVNFLRHAAEGRSVFSLLTYANLLDTESAKTSYKKAVFQYRAPFILPHQMISILNGPNRGYVSDSALLDFLRSRRSTLTRADALTISEYISNDQLRATIRRTFN